MLQHAFAQLDNLVDIYRRNTLVGHCNGGFHHRQRHALGAIAKQLQVALLGRQHIGLHPAIGQIHVATDDSGECRVGLLVVILAMPQRVITVEADKLKHVDKAVCS
jgi:hypothetical protein